MTRESTPKGAPENVAGKRSHENHTSREVVTVGGLNAPRAPEVEPVAFGARAMTSMGAKNRRALFASEDPLARPLTHDEVYGPGDDTPDVTVNDSVPVSEAAETTTIEPTDRPKTRT